MANEDFILLNSYPYNESNGVKRLYDPSPVIVPLEGVSLISYENVKCMRVGNNNKVKQPEKVRTIAVIYFKDGWGIKTQYLLCTVEDVYEKIRNSINNL